MVHVGIHENLKTGLWPVCAATETKLENIMVNPHKEKYAYDKIYGQMTYYEKHLSNFGEVGVVLSIISVKANLYNQGMICMLLGYRQDHMGGIYRM